MCKISVAMVDYYFCLNPEVAVSQVAIYEANIIGSHS